MTDGDEDDDDDGHEAAGDGEDDDDDVAAAPVPTARFNLGNLGAGLATAAKKKAAPAKSTRRRSDGDSDLMETGEAAQSITESELLKARQTHDIDIGHWHSIVS